MVLIWNSNQIWALLGFGEVVHAFTWNSNLEFQTNLGSWVGFLGIVHDLTWMRSPHLPGQYSRGQFPGFHWSSFPYLISVLFCLRLCTFSMVFFLFSMFFFSFPCFFFFLFSIPIHAPDQQLGEVGNYGIFSWNFFFPSHLYPFPPHFLPHCGLCVWGVFQDFWSSAFPGFPSIPAVYSRLDRGQRDHPLPSLFSCTSQSFPVLVWPEIPRKRELGDTSWENSGIGGGDCGSGILNEEFHGNSCCSGIRDVGTQFPEFLMNPLLVILEI